MENCLEGASAGASNSMTRRMCGCQQSPEPTATVTPTPTQGPIKRVFVTSQRFGGGLGGLTGADQKCNSAAASAGLGGTWKAFIFTASQNARDRIPNAEYHLVVGSWIVARSKPELLDGSIDTSIAVNELGGNTAGLVWTDSDYAGLYLGTAYDCQGWTTSSAGTIFNPIRGWTGVSTSTTSWTTGGGVQTCNTTASLYCFEQ